MQKKIILFIIILFVISSAFLLWTAKSFNDPNYDKNWWAVYFENPKSNDLSFVIENHSDGNNFRYIVIVGNDKVEEEDILINRGEVKNIKPRVVNLNDNKKVTVQVTSGEDKKEIYKNIEEQ